MWKFNTLQILHILMIAVDNLREFTPIDFFFMNPHFHTLLELSTTLTIAGDDLGDGTSQQVSEGVGNDLNDFTNVERASPKLQLRNIPSFQSQESPPGNQL